MTTIEDTTAYQHTSLSNFMSVLGYEASPENKWVWKCNGKPIIKINTAVDWHNQCTSEFRIMAWSTTDNDRAEMCMHKFGSNRGYSYETVKLAYESRLVEQVKLKQLKTGEIVTENHMVKYLNKVCI